LVVINGQVSTSAALQLLPTARIKTMDVLQGAVAAAQYGARGRNGVIVTH